ncbi:MAG: tRNA (adenosine(37)-N6)-dimethylallyltransferase MiaA [Phycisphaerales bacterium JB065]
MLPRFPVIVGATASGKSALAVEVAQRIAEADPDATRAEIITMDSMQVYTGLDIGTAKPTTEEMNGVPHHLIDLVDPAADPVEPFTVDDWLGRAEALIQDMRGSSRVPVVVGGTHLYAKALMEGLFKGPDPDPALRAALGAMDPDERRAELERVDPAAARRIHPNDERRTVRALEIYRLTGIPITEHQRQWDSQAGPRPDAMLIGIEWPAEALSRRINERVRQMVEQGLISEAHALYDRGALRPGTQAAESLGYKQLIPYFEHRCSRSEAVERIKIETRRFAKNQRTWLRRLRTTPGSVWIDAEKLDRADWAGFVLEQLRRAV